LRPKGNGRRRDTPWFGSWFAGWNHDLLSSPLLDVQRYLPSSVDAANYRNYQDSEETDLYDKLLRETDFARQRALMRLPALVVPDGL
jgi:hypothetical protein